MKKLIAILSMMSINVIMLAGTFSSINALAAAPHVDSKSPYQSRESTEYVDFAENILYTEDDLDTSFENYSSNSVNILEVIDSSKTSSTAPLMQPQGNNFLINDFLNNESLQTESSSDESISNTVGTVIDNETGKVVSGAAISVNGIEVAMTDNEGRFQIKGLPDDVYDWKVSKDGYCTSEYIGYGIKKMFGAAIFSFYISTDTTLYQVCMSEEVHDDYSEDELPFAEESYSQLASDEFMDASNESENVPETVPREYTQIRALSGVSLTTLPKIKVMYPNGKIYTPAYDYYISTVASKELLEPYSFSHYPRDMTYAQYMELYKAQVVAARSNSASHVTGWSKHHSEGYDLCSYSCCQAFDPTQRYEIAVQAVRATTYNNMEEVLTYNGDIIVAQFFASCAGQTLSSFEKNGYEYAYLQSEQCPYDITNKDNGPRVGLCQDGAAGYAYRGYTYTQILKHYYRGVTMEYAYTATSGITNSWIEENGKWYYFDGNGRMVTGWCQISGIWYYMGADGAMVTGWKEITTNNWYYFKSSGAMLYNSWLEDPSGSNKWYYLSSSGLMLRNTYLDYNGKRYNFNASGLCTNP